MCSAAFIVVPAQDSFAWRACPINKVFTAFAQQMRWAHPKHIGQSMRRLLTRIVFRPWWRLSRGLTLGVRAVVAGKDGVFLVRHSYVPGWHLPGGGVERGETLMDALARELHEEGNIVLGGRPRLHGIFSNERAFSGDHVAVFVAETWTQDGSPKRNAEILETGFFPHDALPEGTSPGTRRRLAEVFGGALAGDRW